MTVGELATTNLLGELAGYGPRASLGPVVDVRDTAEGPLALIETRREGPRWFGAEWLRPATAEEREAYGR